jgi:mRNA interferase MazF
VLSPDLINAHSPMVLIAALTSEKVERISPFEVLIQPPEGGVKQPSKILLMHIRSIDKRRLAGTDGQVAPDTMYKVEEALKIATGLAAI